MVEKSLNFITSGKKQFSQVVQDRFGEAVSKEIFDKIKENLQQIQSVDQAAKLREAEITALTIRLRTIL